MHLVSDPVSKYRNLATDYAKATERNLVTLQMLLHKKTAAESERSRQAELCGEMLKIAWDLRDDIYWGDCRFPLIQDIFNLDNSGRLRGDPPADMKALIALWLDNALAFAVRAKH